MALPTVLADFGSYAPALLRVKPREGGAVVPFRLKPVQAVLDAHYAQAAAGHTPIRLVVLKSRRLGVTTWTAARFFHRLATQPYQRGRVVAHRGADARTIFATYERFWEELPETLAGVPVKPAKVGSRGHALEFRGLDSGLTVESAAATESGRGGEAQLIHLSEAAFYPDPEAFLAALLPQVPATGPSAVIVESTANGPGTWYADFWQRAQDGVNGFTPCFFPWFADPEHRLPHALPADAWTEDDRALAARHGLDGHQLAWLQHATETICQGDEHLRRREFPATEAEAFTAVGAVVWDADVLLACYERRPLAWRGTLTEAGAECPDAAGALWVWARPEPRAVYVIGADPAGGTPDGDAAVASVWRVGRGPDTWPVQVAEYRGHEDPITFARTLTFLGHYYQKALIACEVTGVGRGTQHALQKVFFYPRLHRWMAWDRYQTVATTYGWETSARTRPILLAIADWLLRTRRVTLRSPVAVDEWLAFQHVGPDRVEGLKGDDCVFAALIAWASWLQQLYPGVALAALRPTLARLYGAPAAVETEAARAGTGLAATAAAAEAPRAPTGRRAPRSDAPPWVTPERPAAGQW